MLNRLIGYSKKNQVESIKWVKTREHQVGELDQLKLKTFVLHDDENEELHMAHPVGFIAAKSVSVG